MDYSEAFKSSPQFKAAIKGKIPSGSALTPEDIVKRAQALTCAGCHDLSSNADLRDGLTWPPSLGFTQRN
jgi:hypothetical protein